MKRWGLISVLAVLLVAGCYWQSPEPPVLQVEYVGLFVVTLVNETTGSSLVSYGYQSQTIDIGETFPGESLSVISALVEKGSFGDYVDLGLLTVQINEQQDEAPLGDPIAEVRWP